MEKFININTSNDIMYNGKSMSNEKAGESYQDYNEDQKTSKDNIVPLWKVRAQELKNRKFNVDREYAGQFKYGDDEIGFKHPTQNSFLKFYDNGRVELFHGDETGISFNERHNTINLYGHGVNVNTQVFNLNTLPAGFILNGYMLNPSLYSFCNQDWDMTKFSDLKLEATVRWWDDEWSNGSWVRKAISLSPFKKVGRDQEYEGILKDLNIE